VSKKLEDELARLTWLNGEVAEAEKGLAFVVKESYGKQLAKARFMEKGLALTVLDQFEGSVPATRTITLEDAAKLRDFLCFWLPKETT